MTLNQISFGITLVLNQYAMSRCNLIAEYQKKDKETFQLKVISKTISGRKI